MENFYIIKRKNPRLNNKKKSITKNNQLQKNYAKNHINS